MEKGRGKDEGIRKKKKSGNVKRNGHVVILKITKTRGDRAGH